MNRSTSSQIAGDASGGFLCGDLSDDKFGKEGAQFHLLGGIEANGFPGVPVEPLLGNGLRGNFGPRRSEFG
jgi:hypothetical protein